MAHVIMVTPTESSWRVHSRSLSIDQLFQSGARAEVTAKAIAEDLADEGVPVEIHVFLRDGRPAGKFICPPSPQSRRAILEPASP